MAIKGFRLNDTATTLLLLRRAKTWKESEEVHAKADLNAIKNNEVIKLYKQLKNKFKK